MLSRITQTNKIYIAIVILAANFVLFVKYAWNEAQQESYSHRSVTQAGTSFYNFEYSSKHGLIFRSFTLLKLIS